MYFNFVRTYIFQCLTRLTPCTFSKKYCQGLPGGVAVEGGTGGALGSDTSCSDWI